MKIMLLTALLRDATLSLHGPEVRLGLPQALLIIGLAVLLVALAG